jgi:hypothetical protein
MNYDLLLGQDWLEKYGFRFQVPSLGIKLPAYSETLVRIPTQEKCNRLVEAQVLWENLLCVSGVVECTANLFLCLLVNLNHKEQTLRHFPKTQKLPKLWSVLDYRKVQHKLKNHILQTVLRLAHIKEGEKDVRQICKEYMYVFKLPRDKLTATSGIKHHIPTPSILTNRAVTLRNYTMPEQHQQEVSNHVQKMLEDGII